jgi:hypothetical protein
MATFEIYPTAVEPTTRNVELLKTLGTLGLLASPAMLLAVASTGFDQPAASSALGRLLGLVYCIGWLASLAGLHLTGATGRGRFGRRLIGAQAAMVAIAAAWSVGGVLVLRWEDAGLLHALGDAAWPVGHLTMVAVGLVTLRAGAWTGWARVTPLLCGLALPFALLTHQAGWERAMSAAFGLWTCSAFALMAWAVRTSGSQLR